MLNGFYHVNKNSIPKKMCQYWQFHAFLSAFSHFLRHKHLYGLCVEETDSRLPF